MKAIATVKRRLVVSLLLALSASVAHGYISIPYNSNQYFGPDGPWQAVSVGVYPLGHPKGAVAATIDVFPARLADTRASFYLPTTQACSNDTTGDCGTGGVLPAYDNNSSSWYWLDNSQTGYYLLYNGSQTTRDIALPNNLTTWKSDIVASSIAQIIYPNGATVGVETGLMCLGGSPIAESYSETKSLYQSGLLQSDSFGLQIGAASLHYPGSLIFGGYDRGRAIGPVTTYNAEGISGDVQLLGVTIGVETGGSPFESMSYDGLLVSSTGSSPIAALVKPEFPYIFLPQATINAIVSKLPVTFHSKSGYYLWDTSNSSYERIVNSPAYLGFAFPSNAANAANVTIKVPFKLLNLTLESSISGLDSDVAYFPVMQNENIGQQESNYVALLGRAFLQAAFIGTNWGKNTSWLAQAPGPGANKQGLGYDPTDLYNGDISLNVQSGDSLFRQSWKGHWTVLEDTHPATNNNTSQSSGGNGGGGLSSGAIAGIVVGVVAGLAIIGGLVAILLLRRKKQQRSMPAEVDGDSRRAELNAEKFNHGVAGGELDGHTVSELEQNNAPAKSKERYEMPSPQSERHEMPGSHGAEELPA